MSIPSTKSKRVLDFIELVRSSNIHPAKGAEYLDQDNHLELIEVPLLRNPEYKHLYCWYNSLDYQYKNGGKVIFGWAIWETDRNTLLAQHHAVWQSSNGQYLDVTPTERLVENILFLPDNRAPFDYQGPRAPFNLEQDKNGTAIWVASNGATVGFFSVQVLRLTEIDIAYLGGFHCLEPFNYTAQLTC